MNFIYSFAMAHVVCKVSSSSSSEEHYSEKEQKEGTN